MIYGRELPGYPYNFKAKLTRCLVVGRRIVYGKWLTRFANHAPLSICAQGQAANDLIRSMIEAPGPCLIARYGCGELETTLRGIDVQREGGVLKKLMRMAIGTGGPFWWDNSIRGGVVWVAGYFPETDEALNAFSRRVCEDTRQIDLLGSWCAGETQMKECYCPTMKGIPLSDLEPFWFERPWTGALAGKKVLVVHPFSDTIQAQYAKRRSLFDNPEMLPDYELITYRAISSFAGIKTPYATWFDALDKMCADISKIDFDVALIGCGAYGMSIGAFIKRELGRKALHLGGASQLFFGIKGHRWEPVPRYAKLFNEHWAHPLASDTITNKSTIEGGAYW